VWSPFKEGDIEDLEKYRKEQLN